MNLEKLSQPIQSQSIEEHERSMEDKISGIQLEYIGRLFAKEIPPFEDKVKVDESEVIEQDLPLDDFKFLLNRYSSVLRDLMSYHIAQEKQKTKDQIPFDYTGVKTYDHIATWNPSMYDVIEEEYFDRIFNLYNTDREHWVEKTLIWLKQERQKAEKLEGKKESTEDENEKHGTAGLINYDVDSGYDYWFKNSKTTAPVTEKDTCITIHIDPLYKKTLQDSNTNIFSSNSLGEIAKIIVTKFPETKAIIARSWLMDTPLAKRMGFNLYEDKEYNNNPSFWGQFINSNGQIDNERMKTFLETGKAPYSVALGVATTEDFLKKYLPKEYRGKITLKEINPEFKDDGREHDTKLLYKIGDDWDSLDEEGIKNIISQFSFVKEFDATEEGKGFLNLLLETKRAHKTKAELEVELPLHAYTSAFNKFKAIENPSRFIDKEVIIE